MSGPCGRGDQIQCARLGPASAHSQLSSEAGKKTSIFQMGKLSQVHFPKVTQLARGEAGVSIQKPREWEDTGFHKKIVGLIIKTALDY